MLAKRVLTSLIGLWALVLGAVHAAPLPRTVLAFYNGVDGDRSVALSSAHRYAQMPLNHLGMNVRYWDIRNGVPDAAALVGVQGILLWCDACEVADPAAWYMWLTERANVGVRVVIVGSPWQLRGPRGENVPSASVIALLAAMGVLAEERTVEVTYRSRVVEKNALMAEFERKWVDPWPPYGVYRPIAKDIESHLVLKDETPPGSVSHLVLTGPHGGMVENGYSMYAVMNSSLTQWRIDPFAFFAAALGIEAWPRPDPITLSNERVAFAQVDGVGWSRTTEIFRYRDTGTLCSEVVLRELIEPQTAIPLSVAGADVLLARSPVVAARAHRVRDTLAGLPQVELAQRLASRPQDSGFADNQPPLRMAAAFGNWLGRLAPGSMPSAWSDGNAWPVPDVAMLAEWPMDPWDADPQAVSTVSDQPQVMQPPAWLRGASGAYAAIAPLQLQRTPSTVIVYTGIDIGRIEISALRAQMEAQAQASRRLRPLVLRFGMESGCSEARLRVARESMMELANVPAVRVKPSEYVALVRDAEHCRVAPAGEKSWDLEACGTLGTVRFDRASHLEVDFENSRGILGQRYVSGSLYVALDSSAPAPRVTLRDIDVSASKTSPMRPFLLAATWLISQLNWQNTGAFGFRAVGFGPGAMRWHVPVAGDYHVTVTRSGRVAWQQTVTRDADGVIAWNIDVAGNAAVDVQVTPMAERAAGA